MIKSNEVCVIGEAVPGLTLSHEVSGERFYPVDTAVSHLNDQADIIPLVIPEHLININGNCEGYTIGIQEQSRSYNHHEGAKNRLVLSISVWEITSMEKFTDYTKTNQMFLDGYIYEVPICRKISLGREIADLLAAVNRPHGKSDYIPCIVQGRNARYAPGFEVGAHVKLWGKVQSREYIKKVSDSECEKRIAYEVSVNKLESGEMEMREEM